MSVGSGEGTEKEIRRARRPSAGSVDELAGTFRRTWGGYPDSFSANWYTTIPINGITWAYHEVRHATIGSIRWLKGLYAGPSPPQLFGLGPVPVSCANV